MAPFTIRQNPIAATALIVLFALARSAGAAVPGKNGKIAFSRGTATTQSAIFVINADGSNETQLTNTADEDAADPAWSPDGQKIAFITNRDLGPFEIYVMNADGSGQTRLTNDPTYDHLNPAWSPNAEKIVFTRLGGAADGLYVMNADGSGQTQLTSGRDVGAGWSPDGQRIAFWRFLEAESAWEIFAVNPDGSGQVRLTTISAQPIVSLDWSPDGEKIAISYNNDIYVTNADGSGLLLLTDDTANDHRDPAWSPDGQKIAYNFQLQSPGPFSIHIMNADGSGTAFLTTGFSPSWQPLGLPSPEQQLANLRDVVARFRLPKGAATSLDTKLIAAMDALQVGDTAPACDSLRAFVNEVQALAGKKKLTAAQAQQLIDAVEEIRADIGC